jgi:prepilin-type N-terminal cleavage/methylation domain-containing protein
MISLKRKQQGFTIVELLIVIVVIGILAGLVLVTFNGIQQKARNTERTTDLKAIQSHLEAYNAQNGRYPLLSDMNTQPGTGNWWIQDNMKGLDKGALKDPKGSTSNLAGSATVNQYAYAPTADDGSTCDNSATDCGKYVLTAKMEGGGADYVLNSLN